MGGLGGVAGRLHPQGCGFGFQKHFTAAKQNFSEISKYTFFTKSHVLSYMSYLGRPVYRLVHVSVGPCVSRSVCHRLNSLYHYLKRLNSVYHHLKTLNNLYREFPHLKRLNSLYRTIPGSIAFTIHFHRHIHVKDGQKSQTKLQFLFAFRLEWLILNGGYEVNEAFPFFLR